MLMTAIRTAMPNVTCGRMTERAPSATADSISTPRFIGPGCMTIASGLASFKRALFKPQRPYIGAPIPASVLDDWEGNPRGFLAWLRQHTLDLGKTP